MAFQFLWFSELRPLPKQPTVLPFLRYSVKCSRFSENRMVYQGPGKSERPDPLAGVGPSLVLSNQTPRRSPQGGSGKPGKENPTPSCEENPERKTPQILVPVPCSARGRRAQDWGWRWPAARGRATAKYLWIKELWQSVAAGELDCQRIYMALLGRRLPLAERARIAGLFCGRIVTPPLIYRCSLRI
jgi:hypothetical protein